MNTLLAVIIGALTVYLAYTLYARRIDRHVIQSDPKRATPATLYMDGVDFMPTNRNILFGCHFKSIAAAGPIIGVIVAATLWGWLPAIIWLVLGVSFLGWASDYSAIVLSVRNEGNRREARRLGLTEQGLTEAVEVVQLFNTVTKIADALQLQPDFNPTSAARESD